MRPASIQLGLLTAHVTSKENYSRFYVLPVPFHLRYKGMQHHQYRHTLMAVHVNFFTICYVLLSDGEKWGREEKKTGWAGRAWKGLTSTTRQFGGVWQVTPLPCLMVSPVEMGTMSHISNE